MAKAPNTDESKSNISTAPPSDEEMIGALRTEITILEAKPAAMVAKQHIAALKAALQRLEASRWRAEWRHKKRGTLYQAIGYAELQTDEPVREGATLMVYISAGGKLWARPELAFHDGRFEEFPPPSTTTEGSET